MAVDGKLRLQRHSKFLSEGFVVDNGRHDTESICHVVVVIKAILAGDGVGRARIG